MIARFHGDETGHGFELGWFTFGDIFEVEDIVEHSNVSSTPEVEQFLRFVVTVCIATSKQLQRS